MIRPQTLSALDTLYNECNKGPIQVLVPFFVNIIFENDICAISSEVHPRIKTLLKEKLGIEVPIHAITSLADEAAKEKYLIRTGKFNPLILDAKNAKTNNQIFVEMEKESDRKWTGVVKDLIGFYEEQGYGTLSEKKAESALLDFIKSNSPNIILGNNGDIVDYVDKKAGSSSFQDLSRTAMYISTICGDDSNENYNHLVDLCFGNAIASAVFWWDDSANLSHLKDLDVYLDSPIIFRLLGFDDDGYREAAVDLVETLRDRGAHLFVFEHILSEVIDIFDSAKCWIGNPEYDPFRASKTAQKVIELGLSRIEVEKIIADLPDKLEQFGITRKEAVLANDIQNHQINEDGLHKKISDAYTLRDRDMDATIQIDVKSIGCINKLREGKTVVHLNKAQAVLCTSNGTLSRVSFQFECEEYDRPERSIPLCMPDAALVTIAWLESPGQGKRIAQKRIVAQINGLIEPTAALRKRFCEDLRKRREGGLISDAEYLAIIRQSTVNKMLARRTGNNPDLYTGEALDEIVDQWIEQKAIQKNEVINNQDRTIALKNDEIASYQAKEDKRAKWWGWFAVASFSAIVTVSSVLIGLAFPNQWPLIVFTAAAAEVAIILLNDKIQTWVILKYKGD